MIPNDHAIMMYKFGKNQWIEKILEGQLSFSCAGAFINQAKVTGNTVQGDELEGVFARLLRDDQRVQRMREKFGNNLEEIYDGDFVFLRRKRAKFKPIFCLFAYTAGDAITDGEPKSLGKQKVRLEFDPRLFTGFANESMRNVVSNSHQFTIAFFQPKPFVDRVRMAMAKNNLPYQMRAVEYIDFHTEFYIEPTEEYPELFIKSDKYAYQHEARICLTGERFSTIFDRYPLSVIKFNPQDYKIIHGNIYVEFTADFQQTLSINP